MPLRTDLKIACVEVKFIRHNDLGENKALFEDCQSKGYGIKFCIFGTKNCST
jgi:hypothetical protein